MQKIKVGNYEIDKIWVILAVIIIIFLLYSFFPLRYVYPIERQTLYEDRAKEFKTYQVLDVEDMDSIIGFYFIDPTHWTTYTDGVTDNIEKIGFFDEKFLYPAIAGKPDIREIIKGGVVPTLNNLHAKFEVLRSASVRSLFSDDDCWGYDYEMKDGRWEGIKTFKITPPRRYVPTGYLVWFRCDIAHWGDAHRVACDTFWTRVDIKPITTTTIELYCTDSDGGKAYYTKGVVEAYDIFKRKKVKFTDYCKSPNELMEYYCYGTNAKVISKKCPCSDGRCLRITTTTTIITITTTTSIPITTIPTTIPTTTTPTTTTTTPTTTTSVLPPTTTVWGVAYCTTDEDCLDDGDVCTLEKCVNGECKHIFQDKDGDGICDALDKCPEEYGTAEHGGCPAPPPPWIFILAVGIIIVLLFYAVYVSSPR